MTLEMTSAGDELKGFLKFPCPFTPEQFAENERKWEAYQRERSAHIREERARSARIPWCYLKASLNAFAPQEILDWLEKPTAGLILTGPPGTGKTWTACAVMNEYMETRKCSGRFTTAVDYMDACLDDEDERCFTSRIIVLDDLGKEKRNNWFNSMLFRLVDSRMSTGRKTIITTNYSSNAILARLLVGLDDLTATAFKSRLREFTAVRMEGVDRRGR